MVDQAEMKQRTKAFALDVVRFTESLPRTRSGEVIARQLVRSATSVGANYRAVCRARSRADFISKLGIVAEETDESLYWMELLVESGAVAEKQLAGLMSEANEICAILTSSIKRARTNVTRTKSQI